jgi:hypothetical protein
MTVLLAVITIVNGRVFSTIFKRLLCKTVFVPYQYDTETVEVYVLKIMLVRSI